MNSDQKILTINCGFNWQNEITYFAQLSHNEKRELFFRILWGKRKPAYYFDGVENQEQDITNIDHISFHNDGTIHIIYYNAAKNKEKIFHTKLQNTIFSMPQDVYGPLLILSVYDIDKVRKYTGTSISLRFGNTQNIQYHWEIEDKHQFSLAFFLVGGDVDYKMMLETHFPSVFNIGASPFLMNYFGDEDNVIIKHNEITKVNDLGLLIGYTTRVIHYPTSPALVGSKKSKEFTRIENLYGLSLVPSDEKIRRMV